MTREVNLLMLPGADALVREICAAEGVDPATVIRLLEIEQDYAGMIRRRGIQDAIDAALSTEAERPL